MPDDAGAAFQMPTQPFWTITQAIARIRDLLPELGADGGELWGFLPVVPANAPERKWRRREAVAGTFVAGLELAREGTIVLHQAGCIDPIFISPVENRAPVLAEHRQPRTNRELGGATATVVG